MQMIWIYFNDLVKQIDLPQDNHSHLDYGNNSKHRLLYQSKNQNMHLR